ncbi:MAG: MFS transporter [Candidatus Azosocius agrarius]|nr:MAG: MFS transporter [Gammaproteobacteria bacterium]
MQTGKLKDWDVENELFWQETGKFTAKRNLFCSIPCLFVAFSVWLIWSVVAVRLNSVGFNFTQNQLFTLAAIPGLFGATLRIFYSFVVPIFGGRTWTVFSNFSLIFPSVLIGIFIQDPTTSYTTMIFLAALCGLGGGNFASSMSNISFFYPKKLQGTALGLNAGIGNLGVSGLQFVAPLVICYGIFGEIGGSSQILSNGKIIWLQNAAYIWILPIIISTLFAYLYMDNLPNIKYSLISQFIIFKRKHMYLTTWLYIMSFGSFIGYSSAFPLLIKFQFPDIDPLKYAFLGPMVGAIIRPFGGYISDKFGGAVITFIDLLFMIFAVLGVIYFTNPETKNFLGFFIMFMILFTTTGIANGSVFQLIPMYFSSKESAAVLGFSSAIAAYGAFLIPKSFGLSIQMTKTPNFALYCFIVYYITCLVITWWYYLRNTK